MVSDLIDTLSKLILTNFNFDEKNENEGMFDGKYRFLSFEQEEEERKDKERKGKKDKKEEKEKEKETRRKELEKGKKETMSLFSLLQCIRAGFISLQKVDYSIDVDLEIFYRHLYNCLFLLPFICFGQNQTEGSSKDDFVFVNSDEKKEKTKKNNAVLFDSFFVETFCVYLVEIIFLSLCDRKILDQTIIAAFAKRLLVVSLSVPPYLSVTLIRLR